MHDRDWDDLRYFLAVTRAGSLSGAAAALGVNHSTVLRRLNGLEDVLGVRLFDRSPMGYALTAAGVELKQRLAGIEEIIESAQRSVAGRDTELSGPIRVTTTDTLAGAVLTPLLTEFSRQHPRIELQLSVGNAMSSLSKRESDLALRATNSPPEHLVGRRLGTLTSSIYVSRDHAEALVDEHGEILAWVGFADSLSHLAQAQWMDANAARGRVRFRVDSLREMVEAVQAGAGAAILLDVLAGRLEGLTRVRGPLHEFDTQVWLLTHPDLKAHPRFAALSAFLAGRVGQVLANCEDTSGSR